MIKRSLAVVLTLVMVLSLSPFVGVAEQFTDMPSDWSTEALEKAVENGLIQGYDGKIWPNKNLTRAEMATVINRSFGTYKEASLKSFDDMNDTKWYYDEMAKAVQMRTFRGDGKNLNPENNITREEAFVVLARALKLTPTNVRPLGFTDLGDVSSWATGEIYAMINAGYVQGSNGRINPKANITRAEFAKVMDNVIKQYISEADVVTEVVEGNIMVNVPGVELKDLTITGDLIVGDGVGDGSLTLNNIKIEGRLVVRGGGENSIIIKGNSEINITIIARMDGTVRVYNEAGIEIGRVIVDGANDVILEGNFTNITILAPNVNVYAVDATINTSTISGQNSKLVVREGSTIEKIIIEASGVKVEGNGTVENVEVKSGGNNSIITTPNTSIVVTEGVSGVKGTGNVVIESGVEYKNGETTTQPAEPVEEEAPPVFGGGGFIPPTPVVPTYISSSINGDIDPTEINGNRYAYSLPVGTNIESLELEVSQNIISYKVTLIGYEIEDGVRDDIVLVENGNILGFPGFDEFEDFISKSGTTLTMTFGDLAKGLTHDRVNEWGNGNNEVEIKVEVDGLTVYFVLGIWDR